MYGFVSVTLSAVLAAMQCSVVGTLLLRCAHQVLYVHVNLLVIALHTAHTVHACIQCSAHLRCNAKVHSSSFNTLSVYTAITTTSTSRMEVIS
jgi:hypothetical protein